MENLENRNLFTVSTEWVQFIANDRLKRRLSDDELRSVEKLLQWGFSDAEDIIQIAIDEAIKQK